MRILHSIKNSIKKYNIGIGSILFITIAAYNVCLGGFIPFLETLKLEKSREPQQKLFTGTVEDQVRLLEQDFRVLHEQFARDDIKTQLENTNKEIELLKTQIQAQPHDEFLHNKLSLTNQLYQVLIEAQQAQQEVITLVEQHIKILKESLEDPQFKRLRLELKTYYSFNDLQEASKRLLEYQERLRQVDEKNKNVLLDIANRKKTLQVLDAELKEKQRQREELAANHVNRAQSGFTHIQQGELLDAQLKLLNAKRALAQIKVQEAERRAGLTDSQLFIVRGQVAIVKSEYLRVKRALRVDDAYVLKGQAQLEKRRQESLLVRERSTEKITILVAMQNDLRQELEKIVHEYQVPVSEMVLNQWLLKDDITVVGWLAHALGVKLNEQINLYENNKEYLQAQIEFENSKLKAQEIIVDIIRSWHKMTTQRLLADSDEAIKREIKKYDAPRAELEADLVIANDKRSSVTALLPLLNKTVEELRNKLQTLEAQRVTLFQSSTVEYGETLEAIEQIEDALRSRMEVYAKLLEIYASMEITISSALRQIDTIITELTLKDFWQPSAQAIDWSVEIQRIVPEGIRFLKDLRVLAASYSVKDMLVSVANKLREYKRNHWSLLFLFLTVILALVLFLFFKIYIPEMQESLLATPLAFPGRYWLSVLSAALLGFAEKYLSFLFGWLILYILIRFDIIVDAYFVIMFYLLSIPFFLFLIRSLFSSLYIFNEQHNYVLLSKSYQDRFFFVVSTLLYATATILLFRQAFILGNYHQSNVPTTLLAINFIILQIALLLLISKDVLLSIIPGRTELGRWMRAQINKYHYLLVVFLGAIIVMSNPYVGFSKQVSYIVTRLLIIFFAIPFVLRAHNFLKNSSSHLFFYQEGEVFKERFSYAKTAYGLFVVATFLGFVALGIIMIARVWGFPITWSDISDLLHQEIINSPGIDAITKQPIRVNTISLLKVLIYVAGGILITFIINRIVLRRLFDILVINVGVQNTLLILTRYLIILSAILLGLQSIGLGSLITYIGVALGLLSFAIKDPISDVVCYFVILVQRPIKIGDYIAFDNELNGVVRYITPRSVILRKKNSVTVVVPNSHFISKPIVNWNYTKTFFAFNDILLTVPYSADPEQVRSLIMKVLENYPMILKNPPPIVWLFDFVDNGFQFLVRGYLSADKTLEQWDISSHIRLQIVKTLRENSITIASPTRLIQVLNKNTPISYNSDIL